MDKNYVLFLENDGIKKAQLILDKKSLIINQTKDFIEGGVSAFSLDCVHQLVYYYDRKNSCITAVNITNPSQFATIINKTKGKVLEIKIDPEEGLIFWSQCNNSNDEGIIMKANQDGTNSTNLLKNLTFSDCPILAIDLRNQILYFIDRIKSILGSTDYLGNYKIILSNAKDYLRFSKSMDIFGDRLYWTFRQSIYFMFTDHNLNDKPKQVVHSDQDIDCSTIFDPSKQLIGQNRCFNIGCVGLCLPSGDKTKCVRESAIDKTNNTLYNVSSLNIYQPNL